MNDDLSRKMEQVLREFPTIYAMAEAMVLAREALEEAEKKIPHLTLAYCDVEPPTMEDANNPVLEGMAVFETKDSGQFVARCPRADGRRVLRQISAQLGCPGQEEYRGGPCREYSFKGFVTLVIDGKTRTLSRYTEV